MQQLDSQIQALQERNKRVEADKAWEVSFTRRLSIMIFTYLTVIIFLWWIGVEEPYIHALVPTGGYLLSTLSLPWIRKMWMKSYSKR